MGRTVPCRRDLAASGDDNNEGQARISTRGKTAGGEGGSLLSGFAKVDKVFKALRVRRLYLYPRFQEIVRDELEFHPPTVMELHQSLSPLQQ